MHPVERLLRIVGLLLVVSTIGGAGCGDGPMAPTRYGVAAIYINCQSWIGPDLLCRAPIQCSLYPCGPGTPDDVTAVAVWTVEDERIAAVVGPGRIAAVGAGDTVVRATWGYGMTRERSISVFPGTAPMPTFEIWGPVYHGPTPAAGRIDGAVVEVLTGVIAGRLAVTSAPPDPIPGFTPFAIPGSFRLVGVPPGNYRLRATAEGFLPSEQDASVSVFGGPRVEFQLQPR